MNDSLLTQHGDAVRLTVHVQPGARRNAIVGMHGGALKIAIAAPPVDGKANNAITDFIAEAFRVSRRSVEVASGHTSRRKVIAISGLSLELATSTLRSLIDSSIDSS